MEPPHSDPALYISVDETGNVQGFGGGYVDDLLRAGIRNFRELSKTTSQAFRMGVDESVPCKFSVFRLEIAADCTVFLAKNGTCDNSRLSRSMLHYLSFAICG